MSKEENKSDYYNNRLQTLEIERKKYSNKSKQWVVIRLLTFLAIPITIFFGYPMGGYSALILVVEVVLFLIFVRKSAENKERLNFVKHLIQINENELSGLKGDYSNYSSGEQWIDTNHAFSYDMDVFGANSFFPIVNRTVTFIGEQLLAKKFLNGDIAPKETNEAVEELTDHISWSQKYRAHGMTLEKEQTTLLIGDWSSEKVEPMRWMKIFKWVIPVLAFAVSILYYFDFISGLQFGIAAIIVLLPVRQALKKTNKLHQALSKIGPRVSAMKEQLRILEEVEFKSPLLSQYQSKLFKESENGREGLKELSQLVKEVEYRNNILVAIMLNFFFAWDSRATLKASAWQEKYDKHIRDWEHIVYEMEGLISGANFRYNYASKTTYAELKDDVKSKIEIKQVGHPIIGVDKLVSNDFTLEHDEQFAIITGPNMAGKSTFLRSVGVNLMLAKAGFPVMAEKFVFPNMNLYSSMRTSDNLSDETSYFHAELLRLRFIMDAIERGEPVFIILDEILKGTNSKDKEEGSAKFLQKLSDLGARGIIATHDLSLTSLADKNKQMINLYFDTTIEGEDISFDYTMREGVAKNMNASFLLKKMKLTD
jgi:DNA mismatch repair ATPase MutS